MIKPRRMTLAWAVLAVVTAAACHRGAKPPVARPTPPQPVNTPQEAPTPNRPPAPPQPAPEPLTVPAEPVTEDRISSSSLDDINKNQVLTPVFFALDSDELTPDAQKTLDQDAALLKKYSSWAITIEGHC